MNLILAKLTKPKEVAVNDRGDLAVFHTRVEAKAALRKLRPDSKGFSIFKIVPLDERA